MNYTISLMVVVGSCRTVTEDSDIHCDIVAMNGNGAAAASVPSATPVDVAAEGDGSDCNGNCNISSGATSSSAAGEC